MRELTLPWSSISLTVLRRMAGVSGVFLKVYPSGQFLFRVNEWLMVLKSRDFAHSLRKDLVNFYSRSEYCQFSDYTHSIGRTLGFGQQCKLGPGVI